MGRHKSPSRYIWPHRFYWYVNSPSAVPLASSSVGSFAYNPTPGIATVISLYGLGSLIIHSRRQKRAWIEREMQRLTDARAAFLRGEATSEQLHLLEQERAGEEMAKKAAMEKRRKKEAGVWGRLKEVVGISSGDMGREKEQPGQSTQGGERLLEEGGVEDAALTPAVAGGGNVMHTVIDNRREGETQVEAQAGIRGGPLDVLAGNVASAVTPKSHADWLSWVRGRDKS
jgi:hypothetical protein